LKRGIVEKVVHIECGSQDFCTELLERIDEELSSHATIIAEVRGGKLRFRVIGFEPEVQRTVLRLREIINLVRRSRASPKHGVKADELAKLAKRAVPLDVLAAVLRSNGIPATVKGDMIYADTDMDTLVQYARELGEAIEKASRLPLPYTTRRFAAACSILTGLEPHQVARRAFEYGLLNEDGELVVSIEEAIRRFLEYAEEG